MRWIIESVLMIVIIVTIYQIFVSNNPWGVDMPLKINQTTQTLHDSVNWIYAFRE